MNKVKAGVATTNKILQILAKGSSQHCKGHCQERWTDHVRAQEGRSSHSHTHPCATPPSHSCATPPSHPRASSSPSSLPSPPPCALASPPRLGPINGVGKCVIIQA